MNTTLLEQELTAYFATLLNRTVDTDIFRGALPESVSQGICVRITNRISGTLFDLPTFNIQILGKFQSRADALSLIEAFAPPAVPAYGTALPHFTLPDVQFAGDPIGPYTAPDKGRILHFASINLRISVLTAGA